VISINTLPLRKFAISEWRWCEWSRAE